MLASMRHKLIAVLAYLKQMRLIKRPMDTKRMYDYCICGESNPVLQLGRLTFYRRTPDAEDFSSCPKSCIIIFILVKNDQLLSEFILSHRPFDRLCS